MAVRNPSVHYFFFKRMEQYNLQFVIEDVTFCCINKIIVFRSEVLTFNYIKTDQFFGSEKRDRMPTQINI